jgi:hypothetical protein
MVRGLSLAKMVYQWCIKGVLLFHFHCNILIIAKELCGVWVFPQSPFFVRMRLSSFHASVHRKEEALCLKDPLPHASIQDVQGLFPMVQPTVRSTHHFTIKRLDHITVFESGKLVVTLMDGTVIECNGEQKE